MAQEEAMCAQCGAPLADGAGFCARCGAAAVAPGAAPMEWVAALSILRNRVVVRQLSLVFAIPLAVLALILALILRPSGAVEWGFLARIVLIAAAVFLGLLLIAVLAVYGGHYEYEFRLDGEGIGGRPHGRTAKTNRIANLLLVLSGRPGPSGAGLAAQARQEEYVAWAAVDTVVADARQRTITLQKGRRPLMVVPCDQEHYGAVLAAAEQAAARTRRRRAQGT